MYKLQKAAFKRRAAEEAIRQTKERWLNEVGVDRRDGGLYLNDYCSV